MIKINGKFRAQFWNECFISGDGKEIIWTHEIKVYIILQLVSDVRDMYLVKQIWLLSNLPVKENPSVHMMIATDILWTKFSTHILTVLACYQLVNVDESDLENPEMYVWAANLFLEGMAGLWSGSPYIIEWTIYLHYIASHIFPKHLLQGRAVGRFENPGGGDISTVVGIICLPWLR